MNNAFLRPIVNALVCSGVEFIIIGGVAAALHGSARMTWDLDIVYRRTPENIHRIIKALDPLKPYLRGAPEGLPFRLDYETISCGLNFTLVTTAGNFDMLGELVHGETYESLLSHSQTIKIEGMECRVLGLRKLLEVKRATGRPKDFEIVAELQSLFDKCAKNE